MPFCKANSNEGKLGILKLRSLWFFLWKWDQNNVLGDDSWALAAQRWLPILVEYFATSGFGLDFAVPQVVLWNCVIMELKLKQSLLIELKYLISGSVVPYAIIPIQYFSLWADWSGSLKFSPASFKKAGRLEPVKRKTKNRNKETIATTNSEIDDHLSQRPLSRTGWMASWQIGAGKTQNKKQKYRNYCNDKYK